MPGDLVRGVRVMSGKCADMSVRPPSFKGGTADTDTGQTALTEKQFQQRIVDFAKLTGWLVYHPFDSRRSTPGWPDLALVRSGRLVFAELKSDRGRVSAEQRRWLAALSSVPGLEVFVWRPSDWPAVQRVLARGAR
jgi:hypothetical protein